MKALPITSNHIPSSPLPTEAPPLTVWCVAFQIVVWGLLGVYLTGFLDHWLVCFTKVGSYNTYCSSPYFSHLAVPPGDVRAERDTSFCCNCMSHTLSSQSPVKDTLTVLTSGQMGSLISLLTVPSFLISVFFFISLFSQHLYPSCFCILPLLFFSLLFPGCLPFSPPHFHRHPCLCLHPARVHDPCGRC